MIASLFYLVTAAILIGFAHRFVRRTSALSALVIVLIPLCFTGRALLTGRVYGPVDLPFATEPLNWMRGAYGLSARMHNGTLSDVACQMIPWRAAVKFAIQKGEWPLWNPYLFGGGVLAASAQPAAYSPFTLAACLLPIGTGTTYLASIWFLVAALSGFLLARELGCRESVALFAAAAWPFCTSLAYFILWPLGQSWTLLPLVFLAVRRVVASPTFSSTIFLMIAFALLIVAGHPETVLHVVFAGALYGVFLLARDRTNLIRKIVCAASAGVLALLATAIYLLPIMEALPQTQEYVARKELYAKGQTGASGTEAVVRLAIDVFPWMLFRSWKPPVHVDVLPLGTAAAGSLVVALAIFAIWRVRAAESWFFTGLLVLGLISGTNWQPVSNAWKKLPLFDVSFNDYLAYAAAFSFVVLAALALEHAWRQSEWRLLAVNVALVSLILTAATMVIQRAGIIAPNFEQYGDFRLFAEVAAPALAALLLLSRLPARYTVAALVLLVLAQRTIEEGGVYPVIPAEAAYPPIPILAALPHIREPFRIVGQGLSFIPGTSSVYGLEDVRGYTAMTFAPQVVTWPLWCRGQPVWFNAVDDLERPFLSFLNVRYAITWTHEGDHPGWREVARQRGTKLLENTRVIERAFIPDELTLGSGAPIFEMKKAADFRKRAWIWTDGPEVDQQNGSGTIDLERQNLGFRLSVVMKRAGWIVVSEQAWRGWRAYIDGRRVKIHTANIAFLGIYVPEGKHVVDVRYWPESFVIGRAISFGSIAVVIAIAVAARITRRRRTTVATQS